MENRLIFTISELTRHIKDSLESQYANLWVEGEISNMRVPSSGHCYLTLKDERSQIKAVMFRIKSRALRFQPEDGLKVICRGRLSVYEPRGEYQIIIDTMEPGGIGELQLAFEQLKKRLQDEGLFSIENKKPIPFLPRKIAVVTSPTGAAVRDIINIISRRFPNMEIIIVPVKVQGDDAPDEIVEALRIINDINLADVIILARGGGSLEDLWAFNSEKVARAIFRSKIPLISGVGHETDFTIADFVSDLRAPTPSGAAELVVKEKREIIQNLSSFVLRLRNALDQHIEKKSLRIEFFFSHLQYPAKRITDCQLRHDDLRARLLLTIPRFIKHKKNNIKNAHKIILYHSPLNNIINKRTRANHLTKYISSQIQSVKDKKNYLLKRSIMQLNALNPLNVLERGFSITRLMPSMEIIKDAGLLKQDDCVNVKFSKGEAE
jgi:exodeoxyribonuclease VII large subunit